MNHRKALWRIDLTAGAVGACLGLFLSYNPGAELFSRQKQHKAFQELVGSPVVQTELTSLKAYAATEPSPSEWLGRVGRSESVPAPRYYAALSALIGSGDGWPVEKDGVAALYFQKQDISSLDWDYASPSSIKRKAGDILRDVPSPGVGEYLGLTSLPLIGFLLPWVVLRSRSR